MTKWGTEHKKPRVEQSNYRTAQILQKKKVMSKFHENAVLQYTVQAGSQLQKQNPVRKHKFRGNVALTAASEMFTCSTSRPARFYTAAYTTFT